MRKLMKTLLILAALSMVSLLLAGAYISGSAGEPHHPYIHEDPAVRVVITGDISRSIPALNRWSRSGEFRYFSGEYGNGDYHIMGHYQASLPTPRELDVLANLGFSTLTLPFVDEGELAFLLEEGREEEPLSLLADLSVRELTGKGEVRLINMPLDVEETFMEAMVAEAAPNEVLVVKFQDPAGPWDGDLFRKQGENAIDLGARVIVGDHSKGAPEIRGYSNGLMVSGLGRFLGSASDTGAMVVLDVYPHGFLARIKPLTLDHEGPRFLRRPWDFFSAREILKPYANDDFTHHGFSYVYASLPPAEEEPCAEVESEEDAGEVEVEVPLEGPGMYGVAAGHPLAVEAGLSVLEKGGNAVDAAVAVAYALAVVEPDGSGLGGGGLMLIHLAREDRQVVIDYRETAPSTEDRNEMERIMKWPSTGVPGFVRGMERAVEGFGTMDPAALMEPALTLAREGFPMTEILRTRIGNNSGKLAGSPGALKDFFRKGWPAPVGTTITQPALANTLERIMEEGSSVFYSGYIRDSIIDVLAKENMHMGKQDLFYYEPVIREPIRGNYRDYTVVTVPPPAGGFNLLQQLQILSHFDLRDQTNPQVYKVMEEVLKATYSDRRNYIGDPNFVLVPLEELLSSEYILEKVQEINSGNVPSVMFTDPYRPSDNTTHFVVADAMGNWVSATNTLSYLFGNGLQAEGFFLNAQLKNFSSDPRSPNFFQYGKRPFSHISPALVYQGNTPVMALGSPGGRRIPAYLAQVLVYFADFGLSLEEAVNHPRFWSEGNKLWMERDMPRDVPSFFKARGYDVVLWNSNSYFGRMAALYLDRDQEELRGTGDPLRGIGTFGAN